MSSEPQEQASAAAQDSGRGIGDQIGRYRNAFIAVITMIVLAMISGGYILAHERLYVPSWVPVVGKSHFTLKGEFETAQAVAPGQGQAVTIAGAKIGEIASVDLHNGRALVSMNVEPKYAKYIYKNATMLMRPKSELKDMAIEVAPGTPAAGRLKSGEVLPVSQTSPNLNLDQFLAGLDAETRAYLQQLLAGAGQGLKGNGANLAAIFKRFSPMQRYLTEITHELRYRQANIGHSIHNFQLLMTALGSKDTQLAQVIDSSNAVFRVFAQQSRNVEKTIALLPGALHKAKTNLGKLATAFEVVGPTLHKLHPFATSLAGALEATRGLFKFQTPIIKNQVRPFLREILPFVNKIQPSSQKLAEATPDLVTFFSVFNEFFNELAYNPGAKQGGFLFFLDWANHNFNSVLSSADAHGALGHTLVYFDCNLVTILAGVEKVNPAVRLILGLLHPPTAAQCAATPPAKSTPGAGAGVRASAAFHGSHQRKAASAFDGGLAALASALSGKRAGR
jgi:phospholipid/cholesterol/gamma-HCH transport system substrate-binding protein